MTLNGRFFVPRGGSDWREDLADIVNTAGVYRILNTRTGRCYVGSAKNIRSRWRHHVAYLSSATSGNVKLRRTWAKHGPESFRFEVLELVSDVGQLVQREQCWIDRLDSVRGGYNLRPRAESNLGIKFGPMSQERLDKLRAAKRGVGAGKPSHMLGKSHRPESRRMMSHSKRANASNVISFRGLSMCLSDWADHVGITARGLGNRLRRGWPLERALTEASRGY